MLFRTHVVFGGFCWFVLNEILKMPWFVLVGVLVGVVVVDLDSSRSKIGKRFWFLSFWMKHRGVLHSLLGTLVLSALIGMINLWFGFGVGVGCVSHLVMDALTLRGVKIFWPFGFRVRGLVRSGGVVEDVLFVLFLLVDILFAINLYRIGTVFWYG